MTPTTYQKPEIRDSNDNIIQQGAFGKNTALSNATNDGWIDYVANDLNFLYGLAKDEVVPVSALPASGDMNKTYLLTTNGKTYRWDGTEWVEISSSEAVGRAEAAADLAEEWATKTSGAVDGSEYSAKHYSNVSKDWANKLNATVDGSEYSAKHYAGVAEGWAEDAEDTAEDIADHLSQIDQNTGGVSANSKRIGNIEKLLQGNLYDYDTDDDTAYTKTVPSGAMPYAGLEQIGGKTVVWNQLCSNGNFVDSTGWYVESAGTSLTVSDNILTLTYNSGDVRIYNPALKFTYALPQKTIAGHKYLLSFEINPSRGGLSYYIRTSSQDTQPTGLITKNTWNKVHVLITATNGNTYIVSYIGTTNNSSLQVGDTLKFKNIQVFDLTQIFGAGNEPSTVAEFEAMFPADYYPYNAGTLLSAGVTGVESVGKNLADYSGGVGVPSNTALANTAKRIFEVGKYVVGLTQNNYYNASNVSSVSVTTNSITVTVSSSGYGVGVPFNCVGGEKYAFSMSELHISAVSWYAKDGEFIRYSDVSTNPTTITAPTNAKQGLLLLRPTTNTATTYSNIQIEKAETATAYTPAKAPITFPIPTAIRNLEGYGWSAGTAYNYVDFERKVFVQNVGRVIFDGTQREAWQSISVDSCRVSYSTANVKPNTDAVHADDMIVSSYLVASSNNNTLNGTKGVLRRANGSSEIVVSLGIDSGISTMQAFTDYLTAHPLTVYYALATPVETDISAYLTDDNLISVESGGTLTFPNSNGTDYQIPVPSEETYMIDLQSAIGG